MGASRYEKPCKSGSSRTENQIRVRLEEFRARAGCWGSRRSTNDDAHVEVDLICRVEPGRAGIDEKVDESETSASVSGVDDRNEPLADRHHQRGPIGRVS